MNKLSSTFVTILMLFYISPFAQDFYDINTIRTIHLNFYDANWDFILDTMKLNHNEDGILADIVVDGITYDSVGVRFKGNSSYHPDRVKNPFNIEIDYVKNQDIYGVEKLKLSNMFKDPSCIREVLSYEILRNYMPAPKANFVFLYINDTVHGLYTSVESVNKSFVNDHLGSNDNSFFKCDPVTITGEPEPPPAGCMPVQGIASPLIIMGDDSVCYQQSYEIISDYGWTNLQNLIVELNENTANVHEMLNIDRALWMLVFNNIFVNLDSYTGSGHNYYVYKDDYNRFNTIVWDLNENFGVFTNGGQGPPLNLDQMIHLSTKWNYTNPQRPLISKLMYFPEYWHKYYAHYRTIYNDFLANDAMKNRAVELQQLIDTCVFNDPNLLYSYADFLIALDQNVGFGGGMIPGINVLMDTRTTHLSTHPELIKQGPGITNVTLFPESPTCEDTVWITAHITNSAGCYLYYKTERFAPFDYIQMLDDGNHNDGAPNDDVYGAMVLPAPTATTVFYYIWAYNNDAGMFSPEKAEYDSYSYFVQSPKIFPGDIVINEFLADNGSTIADQDGEYDDWIELYNNTGQDISLTGVLLSDDYAEPYTWSFPDTIIAANDYLIVWADKDDEQEGLHADLKLSKSGEEIILSNPDTTLIDSIQFGQQFTDTTFGRYPNGTGDFQFMPPTFGAENQVFSLHLNIDLKAFLEGAYSGDTMLANLNDGEYLPLSQPYNTFPWNYAGTESVDSIPNADVVDWVLIELRDTTEAALATGETMIARQAAFLLMDGKIIGLDGSSILSFNNSIIQSLFVIIWHRNHLGVISSNPVTESGGVYTYDFTTPSGQAHGTDAQKDLGVGVFGMIAADANADGNINSQDKAEWTSRAGEKGYKSADCNMDGQIMNEDKNDVWLENDGSSSNIPE